MYSVRGTVRAGSQAPPIKARDIRGVVFDMAGYAGRSNLVIFFYRNSRCHTCRDELKDMAGKYGHIARQDGEVVAISNDGFDEAKNLAVDLRLPFRVISDPGGEIIKSYGVYDKNTDTAYPTVFIVDKDAVVRFVRQVQGMDDLLPADEIVNKLRDLGQGYGSTISAQPFRSR